MNKINLQFDSFKIEDLNENSSTNHINVEEVFSKDIAIIGMGARFPEADSVDEFWENIKNGIECVKDFPATRSKDANAYLRYTGNGRDIKYTRGAYLKEIDKFDYKFFRLTPNEAKRMNPSQRLFLEVAWEAIENSGYGGNKLSGSSTGVYVGYIGDLEGYKYKQMITEVEASLDSTAATGNLSSIIPSRISYILDLKGPTMLIDTACSSSLVAVHQACQAIRRGECQMAIAGGVRISFLPLDTAEKIGMESSDGRTRTFDNTSDGTGMGEGVAAVVLKPLSKAIADGDSVYAVIKGSAINQDGSSAGITAPNVVAQEMVITSAWKDAGVDAETIAYIEAHGTGTKLGDPIEIDGIQRAFRKYTDKKQFCAIGSVKSNIGHLFEAAGIAALIKAALVLKHKQLPPSINFRVPNKNIRFEEAPVYVNDRLVSLNNTKSPLRCGVSAFGFSGTNCHVILEEAPEEGPLKSQLNMHKALSGHIFTISAKDEAALKRLIYSYKVFLNTEGTRDIDDICYTANTGRGHYSCRLAAVVRSVEELRHIIEKLDSNINSLESDGICWKRHQILADGSDKTEGMITSQEKYELDNMARCKSNEFAGTGIGQESILNELCRMYIKGADIDWESLYQSSGHRKAGIPAYPFERTRCWIDIPEVAEIPKETENIFYSTEWLEEYIDTSGKRTSDGAVLLICGEEGRDSGLTGRLKADGIEVIEVMAGCAFEEIDRCKYTVGNSEEDYLMLMSVLKQENVDTVVHAATLNGHEAVNSLEELESSQEKGIYSLFYLIKALSKEIKRDVHIVVVSEYVNEVAGNEEMIKPYNAPLFGLGKAANLENPNISIRCIDIDRQTNLEMLLPEIRSSEGTYRTAYRNGKRYIEVFKEKETGETEKREIELKGEGAYVITGGMGGIGLEIAKYLSSKAHINLVFINRSRLMERSAWKAIEEAGSDRKLVNKIRSIQAIESKGSRVDCFSADISNENEMKQVFADIKSKHGRINGIIHSAGIAGDGLLANKPRAALEEVLNPKVKGTWIIDSLTEDEEPDFFIMFSSIATLMNLAGQGAYVAANSFLDSYGAYRSKKGKNTQVINWGAWKETGMAVESGSNVDGVFKALPTDAAVEAFGEVIDRNINKVIIAGLNYGSELLNTFKSNLPLRLSDSIESRINSSSRERRASHEKAEMTIDVKLKGRNDNEYSQTEKIVAQIHKEVLGFDEIDVNDKFFDMGGDSIMLTKLHTRLNKEFPGRLTVADLFAYPSVAKLAGYISKGDETAGQSSRIQEHRNEDIAIIGMSGRFPDADSIEDYWKNIQEGKDCITKFPQSRKNDIKAFIDNYMNFKEDIEFADGGYLKEVDQFDYAFFRITPKEASMMDPNQRLFLETAWKAVEDSGYGGERLSESKTGVFIGFTRGSFDYDRFLTAINPYLLSEFIVSNLASVIPGRIAYAMNLKGPTMLVDTACSSSLVAVHLACKAIRNGECDAAIAGGVKLNVLPICKKGQGGIGIESSDGRARTFDDSSEGTGWGEGTAAIVLKPLSKAREDRDHIYAVIKGSAVNQDGASSSITAPNSLAQADLLDEAWADAGVDPESIGYIEAHGTGTKLGDPIEIDGIQRAFRKHTQKRQFCAVGSVKTSIGHLDTASGVAGLIRAAMALKHKKIPGMLHFERPNRNISFEDSPVYINDRLREWKTGEFPRRCGVSAFGFSGTNCHVVLEEVPEDGEQVMAEPEKQHIFTVSAKNEHSLKSYIKSYTDKFQKESKLSLRDVCYTANAGRGHYGCRIALIAASMQELKEKLYAMNHQDLESPLPKGIYYQKQSAAGSMQEVENASEGVPLDTLASEKCSAFISGGRVDSGILEEICRLYTMGAGIDWEAFYDGLHPRKISLPTYPFNNKKCWIKFPEEEAADAKKPDIAGEGRDGGLYYSVTWRKDGLLGQEQKSSLDNGTVLLLKDWNSDLGEIIAQNYREQGKDVIVAGLGCGFEKADSGLYLIDGSQEGFEKLLADVQDRKITTIVHMLTLDVNAVPEDTDSLEANMEKGVYSLFYLYKALMADGKTDSLAWVVISQCVNDITGNELQLYPENSMLFALGRVIVRETPGNRLKLVDTDRFTDWGKIGEELEAGFGDSLVAYRQNERYIPVFGSKDVESGASNKVSFSKEGVYLITGGLGGLGLEIAKAMAAKEKVKLALAGRSGLPERTRWDGILSGGIDKKACRRIKAIEEIESLGAEVVICSVDIEDCGQVSSLLNDLRAKYGKINGIIHCAGLAGTGLLNKKSEEDFKKVLAPKTRGTFNLDKLTEKDRLEFFVLFSSVASIFPSPGQSDYAAANAYMDSFAACRNRKGKKTISINWVAWKEAGMSLDNEFTLDTIFKAIPTRKAVEAFGTVLSGDLASVLIGELNLGSDKVKIIDRYHFRLSEELEGLLEGTDSRRPAAKQHTMGERIPRDIEMTGKDGDVDYSETEIKIANICQEIFGFEEINIYDSFFEIGVDSILLVKLHERVEAEFGKEIAVAVIFENSSIAKLSSYIDSLLAPQKGSGGKAGFEADLTRLLDELEGGKLSMDELLENIDKI